MRKKYFYDIEDIKKCYEFALNMKGNHNPDMIMEREDWEIFRDDFRGKLGEIAVRNYIRENINNDVINNDLDFTVTPRGQWDITDLVVNNKNINVKSIKQGSKFLLIETDRYNQDGTYRYNNNDGNPVPLDYYVLVRVTVEPDVSKSVFNTDFKSFFNKAWDARMRKEVQRTIYAEVLGGISHEDFWNQKTIAPRGIRCSVKNLAAVVSGKELPDRIYGYEKKNEILQRENYVISSDTQLKRLEDIL